MFNFISGLEPDAKKWKAVLRGIAGKQAGALPFVTMPSPSGGQQPILENISALIRNNNTISTFPSLSIGTNSPNYDNIVPITALLLTPLSTGAILLPFTKYPLLAGQTINFNITTPGVAVGPLVFVLVMSGVWA